MTVIRERMKGEQENAWNERRKRERRRGVTRDPERDRTGQARTQVTLDNTRHNFFPPKPQLPMAVNIPIPPEDKHQKQGPFS